MLDDGFANGRQIVPADWVAGCRTGDRAAFEPNYAERYAAFPDACYSRQWWVLDRKAGRHAAMGVFGQMIYIDPPAEIVAVKLSSWPYFLNDSMRLTTIRAVEAMARELG
jgi:CubicO group peptidase (beta-lactamase class C family)